MKTKFHVSCCGRSGSKFVAAALRAMGFAVVHEMGDDWAWPKSQGVKFVAQNPTMFQNYDGFIGWKWSLLTPKFARALPIQIHLVRAPMDAIESATTHQNNVFDFIERKLGAPDFLDGNEDEDGLRLARAINYWIRYNATIGSGKPHIRVEDFYEGGEGIARFCELVDVPQEPAALVGYLPKDINQRKKAIRRVPVSWPMVEARYPVEAIKIREMANFYGYGDVN